MFCRAPSVECERREDFCVRWVAAAGGDNVLFGQGGEGSSTRRVCADAFLYLASSCNEPGPAQPIAGHRSVWICFCGQILGILVEDVGKVCVRVIRQATSCVCD